MKGKALRRRIAPGPPALYPARLMTPALAPQRDPLGWTVAIALAFLALCWHRLGIPSKIYFVEIHYVQAALKLLELTRAYHEHLMLG